MKVRVIFYYLYVGKWAGPKCYLGQDLGMVRVRISPAVKILNLHPHPRIAGAGAGGGAGAPVG